MFNAFSKLLLLPAALLSLLPTALPGQDGDKSESVPRPAAQTVLIFANQAGDKRSEFIVRLARYRPDIVLEWENEADQGTVHLFRSALSRSDGFTLSRHFEVGVQSESSDQMTLWLPDRVFEEVSRRGSAKLRYNSLPLKLKKEGEGTFRFRHGKREVEIPVLRLSDARQGNWTIWDDPQNPLVVQYESPYFKQSLKTMLTPDRPVLRWIKKLPPVR